MLAVISTRKPAPQTLNPDIIADNTVTCSRKSCIRVALTIGVIIPDKIDIMIMTILRLMMEGVIKKARMNKMLAVSMLA